MSGISEAIAALKGIRSIADRLTTINDETKVIETKLALMGQIYEVRVALDSLQEQLATAQAENIQLRQINLALNYRLAAADDYDLIELLPGVQVLAAKPFAGATHKPPYLCHACYDDGKKSVLSFEASAVGRTRFPAYLNCQRVPKHTLSLPGGTKAETLGFGE